MHYDKKSIDQLDRVTRLKLINSVTGVKSGNLVGTVSESGHTNWAVFSSIVHLGSNPSLLGFISRPQTEEVGHTFRNIRQTGFYTINHIHPKFAKKAHYTSAKFPSDVSEFDACELSELYVDNFKAPFVKESVFKMGVKKKLAESVRVSAALRPAFGGPPGSTRRSHTRAVRRQHTGRRSRAGSQPARRCLRRPSCSKFETRSKRRRVA